MENGKGKRKKYLCLSLVFIASGHAWKQLDLAFMCWIWKSIKRETCRNVLHNFSFLLFLCCGLVVGIVAFSPHSHLMLKKEKTYFASSFFFFHSSDCEKKVDFMEL